MILCVGEILADMIGEERDGRFFFERKVGGAPFNVACAVQKCGGKAGFVGCVGEDLIGEYLSAFAEKQGFDYLNIGRDGTRNTTLAFVQLSASGERSFCFYRKNTADYALPPIGDEVLGCADIVHIGSLMLSEETGRIYARALAGRAHIFGKKVSFDVNFRRDIFPDERTALKAYGEILPSADIVKMSEDEAELFGEYLSAVSPDTLVCITRGAAGSEWRYGGRFGKVPAYRVKPVDTTGAGDAFFGGVLTKLDGTDVRTPELLNEALKFGNACGALNTLGRGATDALPIGEETKKFIDENEVKK